MPQPKTIALAAADRPLVRELLAAGEIQVDYLETAGPLVESVLAEFPRERFLLHNSVWNWSLAHPNCLNRQDVLITTLNMIDRLHAPWLSIHLGFSAEEVEFEGSMKPVTAPIVRTVLFDTICQNLIQFAAVLPVPLLVENLDYNPTGAYETICEPDFIAAVVETADIGLLLDLAHARVSAARMDIPIQDYLQQLPLHRVKQLHISGPRWQNGVLSDAHEPLLDEDFAVLEMILAQTSPRALTLEYGKDASLLKTDLARLRTLLAR